jgi:hypothetical protein
VTLITTTTAPRVVREGDGYITHTQLKTWVERHAYDYQKRIGEVWCRGPVDMDGAIALFLGIDDGVKTVIAYIDGQPDVRYRKLAGGDWKSTDLERPDVEII